MKELTYITLRVRRPMSPEESSYINKIDDPAHKAWELDRQSMLFEIAVLAKDTTQAVKLLRALLKSPSLVIEVRDTWSTYEYLGTMRNGDTNDKKVQTRKSKGRRV